MIIAAEGLKIGGPHIVKDLYIGNHFCVRIKIGVFIRHLY